MFRVPNKTLRTTCVFKKKKKKNITTTAVQGEWYCCGIRILVSRKQKDFASRTGWPFVIGIGHVGHLRRRPAGARPTSTNGTDNGRGPANCNAGRSRGTLFARTTGGEAIAVDHSKYNQMLLLIVTIGKIIKCCAYGRSYLLWSPVVERRGKCRQLYEQ